MFGGDDGDAERLEPATWTLRAAEEQRCALDDDEGPPSDAVGRGDARQDRGQWQAQSNGQSRGRRGEPAPARSPREPQERGLHRLYRPAWIAEMVAAFDRDGDRVVYVQGTSRFAPGLYAHVLSPVYWRSYEPEGPINQVYSAHNLAIRRADVDSFQFEDTDLRAGLERTLSERIRRTGRVIWHNRRTVV